MPPLPPLEYRTAFIEAMRAAYRRFDARRADAVDARHLMIQL